MMIMKPAAKLFALLKPPASWEQRSELIGGMRCDGKRYFQFNIVSDESGKFLSGSGPGIDFDGFILTEDEAFGALAGQVRKLDDPIFHLPMLPLRGVDHVMVDIHQGVVIRVVDCYEPRIDQVLTRYDILVEPRAIP